LFKRSPAKVSNIRSLKKGKDFPPLRRFEDYKIKYLAKTKLYCMSLKPMEFAKIIYKRAT